MATRAQQSAAKKNIQKAQATWCSMTRRQRSLAQPQGRERVRPGVGGKGRFYRVEVRPKSEFVMFRIQDVGEQGNLERLAGKRPSGSWGTAAWLVEKKAAHVNEKGELVIDNPRARTALKQIRGPIMCKKGDIFQALPRKNVPESAKPTQAQRRARTQNIRKAQVASKRKRLAY